MDVDLLSTRSNLIHNFNGPICAVASPFVDDLSGQSNTVEIIRQYAKYLIEINVKGVYILGTTGESFAMSIEEKLQLISDWYTVLSELDQTGDKRLLAIVNVSAMSLKDSIKMVKLVEKLQRFDAIALLAPIFYQVQNCDQLIVYIRSILNHTNGRLPFLYYHFPDRIGKQNFELEEFIAKALNRIPQFTAMKYTDTNIVQLYSIQRRFSNRLKIFAGYDETLLAALTTMNIDAAICATFNLEKSTANYLRMLETITNNGDLKMAQQLQNEIAEICDQLRSQGNFFTALKQGLNKELAAREYRQMGPVRAPISL